MAAALRCNDNGKILRDKDSWYGVKKDESMTVSEVNHAVNAYNAAFKAWIDRGESEEQAHRHALCEVWKTARNITGEWYEQGEETAFAKYASKRLTGIQNG